MLCVGNNMAMCCHRVGVVRYKPGVWLVQRDYWQESLIDVSGSITVLTSSQPSLSLIILLLLVHLTTITAAVAVIVVVDIYIML